MEEEKKPDEENKEGMMMEEAPKMEWLYMPFILCPLSRKHSQYLS